MADKIKIEDILENLAEGVVGVDADLCVQVFNQEAERMAGVSRSQVVGRKAASVFRGESKIAEMLEKTLVDGRPYAEHEDAVFNKFSGPVPVSVSTSLVTDASGAVTGASALLRDLSSIKSLEAGTMRRERLASIGEFAANLAHELKNPLSGLRGAAQLLKKRATDERTAEYSGVIMREADRLNVILDDMLDFARPARLERKPFNIHQVLDSVATIIAGGEEDPSFEIVKEYDPSLPDVYGDDGPLTQVFLNLVKNAREALPAEGGVIRVITRVTTDFLLVEEAAEATETTGGRGEHKRRGMLASIEVRDNGGGIKPEDLEHIFTPFFTTKAGGSGLGMPITLKIVKEHGGLLRIDSTPGEGTSVRVYLPVV